MFLETNKKHLFNIFNNCLAILFNISHPTDFGILYIIFCEVRNFFVYKFLSFSFSENYKTHFASLLLI